MQWREYVAELSNEQIKGIAEISRDIGQVSLASIVIPAFIPGFEGSNFPLIVSGAILMLGMWATSITLVKNI